ncbi:MAG: hypothetical protein Q9163_000213 [Psora crenata]
MEFKALNMESDMPASLQGQYDIVIGTNCVHATTNKMRTISRLRSLLYGQGFIVLSEVTQLVDWYDIVFGLLDGWWPSKTGPPTLCSLRHHGCGPLKKPALARYRIRGARAQNPTRSDFSWHPMIKREAIRSFQTACLLNHNVLPVSIDYRLYPENNLLEGPIADVCDAYAWVQTGLQAVVKNQGILVDEKRIVVIGWSTGGHLAMTTAWKNKEAGLKPPVAILSFYGPTDFESGGTYTIPTFFIHGTEDEIVLYHTAVTFSEVLREMGVRGGLAEVKGARHIHDLGLKEGAEGWWNGVGVGYDFLFRELKGDGFKDSGPALSATVQ